MLSVRSILRLSNVGSRATGFFAVLGLPIASWVWLYCSHVCDRLLRSTHDRGSPSSTSPDASAAMPMMSGSFFRFKNLYTGFDGCR